MFKKAIWVIYFGIEFLWALCMYACKQITLGGVVPIPISADAVHAAYLAMARFPDKRFSFTKLGKNQPIYGVKLPYLKAKNK